ncbi:hypothetical protein VTN96DRAFT_9092 [Rasamsonia emersonii]
MVLQEAAEATLITEFKTIQAAHAETRSAGHPHRGQSHRAESAGLGVVVSVGSEVPADAPQPGTRVAAFAPSFQYKGAADYGAFQERVLVPFNSVVALPDAISFPEASTLPMAVQTSWAGWYMLGVPVDTQYAPEDKNGVLIWGGSSSIGTAAIQTARSLGLVVYATASSQHHEYLKSLGASKVFDYKAENVEETIVKAVKDDGVSVQMGFLATGPLKPLNADGGATLASAPLLPQEYPQVDGVTVKFITLPFDEKDRGEYTRQMFHGWLRARLASGEYIPSPRVRVLDGGLGALRSGLDVLEQGVSAEKLVVEV